MKLQNYEYNEEVENFKQNHPFMPDRTFRMLITVPSGSGKTNCLLNMIFRLLYFDKIYLYARHLQQERYQILRNKLDSISREVGYPVLEVSNDDITPLSAVQEDNQKIVVFDDYMTREESKIHSLIISSVEDTKAVL